MDLAIELDREAIADFCRRWKITEFSVFGSVLRDDFGADSDLDVLVDFVPGQDIGLWDLSRMERELSELVGRPVDLLTRGGVEHMSNGIRRRAILSSLERLDVA